ncbi:MAG: ABC transporter permease, partial [Planctomycetaceae bacterium]|nr:ABC transporter permease [Planctomycetaceae bacterium]
ILPGLVLAYLETIVLAAVAIAISTRLPLLPNLSITLAVYLLGNLIPEIVQSSVGQIAMVGFAAELISAVLPCLGHFNMETAIAMGKSLPPIYVVWAAAYALLYCLAALVVSLLLFEDRDVA